MFSFRPRMISIVLVLMFAGAAVHLARAQQTATTSQTQSSTAAGRKTEAAPASPTPGKLYPPELGETPEHRATRLGTQSDPGPDPDPNTVWMRFGSPFHIIKFARKFAKFDVEQENWVRPRGDVNIPAEIYRQDADSVWAWLPVVGVPDRKEIESQLNPATHKAYRVFPENDLVLVRKLKPEFVALKPADSGVTVTFHEASDGLPKTGSWRNGLAVADMNEDGKLDLILPPERGGAGSTNPYIYLGDGNGHWAFWKEAKWPIPTNYGSVAVADLNHDGHMDVVLGIHLRGVKAFLGDGKGHFVNSSEALPDDFPTRRVILSDVNGDGNLDIVALSELTSGTDVSLVRPPYLRAWLNDGKAKIWKRIDIGGPLYQMGGDWLTAGDFNGDKIPDFSTSSVIFSSPDTIFLSGSKKLEWNGIGRNFLPFYSYYWASTAGKFVSKDHDDLVVSYDRIWPGSLDPAVIAPPSFTKVTGLDLIRFNGNTPVRTPIVHWEGNTKVAGMASADFDGDGNLDLIYWRNDPAEFTILLGDGHGNFKKAAIEGLASEDRALYDIKVADVNGDGRPDVIVMYETQDKAMVKNGSVHVFLNATAGKAKGSK